MDTSKNTVLKTGRNSFSLKRKKQCGKLPFSGTKKPERCGPGSHSELSFTYKLQIGNGLVDLIFRFSGLLLEFPPHLIFFAFRVG